MKADKLRMPRQAPDGVGGFRLVVVESPFAAGDPATAKRNIAYARAAMADCLARREAPFASHLLYTQDGVLDDGVADERVRGINAGLEWARCADATVVYSDFGVSHGMAQGVAHAEECGRPIERRVLGGAWRKASSVDVAGDEINHPSHYRRNGIEIVDVVEAFELGPHEAQAVQYLTRAKFKGEELRDLKKAGWWIERRVAQIEAAKP